MEATAVELGIRVDGVTDNALMLMNVIRRGFTLKPKQCHVLSFSQGEMLSSNNRWMFGFYWLKIVGNGVTFRSIYNGNDEMMNRPLSQGELLQTNVMEYIGTKLYRIADRFGDVKAGGNKIPLLSNNGKYKAGDRILMYQGNYFNEHSYPPPCPAEVKVVDHVDAGGFLYTTLPVEKNYINNQWDNPNIDGGGCGKPRMINLDDPNNIYPELLEIDGVNFGRSTSDQPGNVAMRARRLKLTRCKIDRNSWFWPTESESIEVEDCDMGPVEFDKLSRYASFKNVRSGPLTNGGAFDRIEIADSFTGPISLCPRDLTISKTHIRSNGQIDRYLPALSIYAAKNPIRRVTLDRLTFSSEPDSLTDSHIAIAPIGYMAIHNIDGKSILTDDFDIVKTLEPGTTVMYEEGATDGGLITSITHNGKYFVITGNWNNPPREGDVWKWSYVKDVIDLGGHMALDGKRIWNENSLRWKGNTSTCPIKTMHLTEKDFIWKAGENGNLTVVMDAYIESIECFLSKQYGDKKAMINIQDQDYVTLTEMNTRTARQDFYDCKGEWIKKLNLNTYSITGPVTGDILPKFDVVVKWRPF